MARNFVLVLDAVAVLLLVVALVSRGLFHGRALVYRTVRVRPSLVAAGISLLSASFILFMLNLSGPVP